MAVWFDIDNRLCASNEDTDKLQLFMKSLARVQPQANVYVVELFCEPNFPQTSFYLMDAYSADDAMFQVKHELSKSSPNRTICTRVRPATSLERDTLPRLYS